MWWRDGDVALVAVDPQAPERVRITVVNAGDYVTEDEGRSWQRATDERGAVNLSPVAVGRWHRAGPTPTSSVSTHTGPAGGDRREPGVEPGPRLRCVAASTENADTLYAGQGSTLLVSYDAGSAWNTLAARGLAGDINVLLSDLSEQGRLWAGTTQGIFHSLDGGFFWTGANAGLDGLDVRALAPTDDGLLAAVHPSAAGTPVDAVPARIHRLPRGSARWWPVTEPLDGGVASFARAPDGRWYAGTSGGSVLATRDAGASWQVIASGLPTIRSAAVTEPASSTPPQGGPHAPS